MTEFTINDQTPIDHHEFSSLCGCLPRREPVGGLECATTSPMDLIPWEEIPDRIADQERNKSSLYHRWLDSKIGVLNQNPLLYCWAFSSVEALMLERELMGLPYIPLSPSSVGAPVVNFANTGWYIEEALKQMVNVGAASTDYVPETTCDRSEFKQGWKESAACNRVTKWRDLANNTQAQLTALLTDRPLVCVHLWWKHAITHLQAIDLYPKLPCNNPLRYGRKPLNSWGPSYGKKGIFQLEGQRSIADQSYCILQANFAG